MHSSIQYCHDFFAYSHRNTREIKVGYVGIGEGNPIRVQSTVSTDALDTQNCIQQILDQTEGGAEIINIPIPTKKHAANLEHITNGIRKAGCFTPLVADVCVEVDAAFEAVQWVEKIRINPGLYPNDPDLIYEDFSKLIRLCKKMGRAMRIGTACGTLSDRIMEQFGDTPLGMAKSAMEFARIAKNHDYHQFCFSMKASDPRVIIKAYRLLITHLNEEGADWNYPIHLGVTTVKNGKNACIKSAIAIGSLLADGIGDTIQVSLCEDPMRELLVAQTIIDDIQNSFLYSGPTGAQRGDLVYDPFNYSRRRSEEIDVNGCHVGGDNTIRVFTNRIKWGKLIHRSDQLGERKPEATLEDSRVIAIDPYDTQTINMINAMQEPQLVTVVDGAHGAAVIHAFRLLANKLHPRHPILLKDTLRPLARRPRSPLTAQVKAARNIGSLLCDGIGDAVLIQGEFNAEKSIQLAYNILQASG